MDRRASGRRNLLLKLKQREGNDIMYLDSNCLCIVLLFGGELVEQCIGDYQ